MTQNIARRHHFVPEFYLRGFCGSDKKLFVVDAKERKQFRTQPENVAVEKDFNRVNIDGIAPDALEKAYGAFEGKAASALARIIAKGAFEDENDRAAILNLMALLTVRSPQKRQTIGDFQHDLCKVMLEMTFATPERWESQVKQMRSEGYLQDVDETMAYEQLRDFVKKGNYKIRMNKEWQIQMELRHLDDVLPYFFMRKWSLYQARKGTNGFITSDHPVSLMWSKAEMRKGFHGPGLAMGETEIVFPLCPDLCLLGRFEGEEKTLDADYFSVASINARVIGTARRQVYAPDSNYVYMRAFPQEMGKGATLLQDPNLANVDDADD
jgi:hypothetical protein